MSKKDDVLYIMSDWTSASKLINHINPLLTVRVYYQVKDNKEAVCHLTVYHKITKEVFYAFYVDYSNEESWSLTTEEAVKVLNQIGFRCEMKDRSIIIPPVIRNILESLYNLGFTLIYKTNESSSGIRVKVARGSHSSSYLDDIIGDYYEYSDYSFLKDTSYHSIKDLLDHSKEK